MNGSSDIFPAAFVVFGITGDLASRKLLPALYQLFKTDLLHEHTTIIGTSRRNVSVDELLETVEVCVLEETKTCDPAVLVRMKAAMRMVRLSPDTDEDFERLKHLLDELENESGQCMNRLYYLSVPPAAFTLITQQLGAHGLNASCQHGTAASRLLVEKPFGYDYASAKQLIDDTESCFREPQVFRIDHYLAKETVQNILTFRRHNPIFSADWNNQHIESIDVCAYETIDIEGRADFYESTGALRDFVQSHLLQLLALVTLELPRDFVATPWLHEAKLRVLESTQVVSEDTSQPIIRGQYAGYRDEVGNPDSTIETFVRLPLQIDNHTWSGTRLTVSTGKATREKRTDITLVFKDFYTGDTNKLIFRIQPNEGISVELSVKQPGFESQIQDVDMNFSYESAFGSGAHPDAYERVLLDAVKGDRTLFATSDEVLESWRILTTVQELWAKNTDDLVTYAKGAEPGDIVDIIHRATT